MKRHVQCSPLAAVLLTSLLPAALANFNTTCPTAITDANATGTVVFTDPITQQQSVNFSNTKPYTDVDSKLLDNSTVTSLTGPMLAYSLTVSTTQIELSGQKLPSIVSALSTSFYKDNSSRSANPFRDENQWAACAIPILNLPALTTRYGQSDTGNCEATLPYGCVEKILNKLWNLRFTYSERNGGLSTLCDSYGNFIRSSVLELDGSIDGDPVLPSECTNLFRENNQGSGPLVSKVKGFAITSKNDTTVFSPDQTYECPSVSSRLALGSSIRSYPFYNTSTQYNSDTTIASGGSYDEAVRAIYPIITIFFNGVNFNYFGYPPAVSASMSCVRVNDFSQGSRVSPELQPATPPSQGLSTGAKAGIAIGVILAVVVAAGLGWLFLIRKRQLGGRKDYGQPKWYQNPTEVFRRGGGNARELEKSEYEMMTK